MIRDLRETRSSRNLEINKHHIKKIGRSIEYKQASISHKHQNLNKSSESNSFFRNGYSLRFTPLIQQ